MAVKSKETQQTRKVEFQHFQVKKFKITPKGVDITHIEIGEDTGEIATVGRVVPHPDLKEKMNQLKIYMATRLGLLQGWDFSRANLKLKNEDLLKQALDGHKDAIDSCNVNGLTFVGEGDLFGVIITGSLKTPKGGSAGMAIPKITFGKEVLGYEKEVEEICDEIKEEIYAYRFQHKKAQLDIETEAEKGLFKDEDKED